MPPPSNDDDTEWPSFIGPQYPAVLDGDDAPLFWCDFFWLLDDSFARVVNLASSARSRQTRTSPVVGESSRVSIREHAIMFWVGRSAAACAVVIVGTCLPLVFGHHFLCAFFVFLCHRAIAICHRLLLHAPCFSSFLLFHVSSLSFHVNSYNCISFLHGGDNNDIKPPDRIEGDNRF